MFGIGRTAGAAAGAGRVPMPEAGELVRITPSGAGAQKTICARVRAVQFRRIQFEMLAESAGKASSLAQTEPTAAAAPRGALTVSFARGDALYEFATRTIGSSKLGSLVVQRPTIVTRVQRREYYRLPLEIPTTLRPVRSGGDGEAVQVARLVNLSGGGALVATASAVPIKSMLRIRVPSGRTGDPMDAVAEVVASTAATVGSSRVFLLRCKFLHEPWVTEEDRDAIIAYIFQQQRLMLRSRRHS